MKTVADPLSAEGLRACAAAASRAAEKAKAEGIDVAQYDLDSTVRDIEAARKALGFDRISTSGSSFGGAVGYCYSLTFPDRVKRSVLIEVAFPWNLGLAEPSGVDTQIATFDKARLVVLGGLGHMDVYEEAVVASITDALANRQILDHLDSELRDPRREDTAAGAREAMAAVKAVRPSRYSRPSTTKSVETIRRML